MRRTQPAYGFRLNLSPLLRYSDEKPGRGIIPQLWADCIGGAVEAEYLRTIRDAGFRDVRVINRLDYFLACPSDNTKRLTNTFGAETVVLTARIPTGAESIEYFATVWSGPSR